MVLNRDKVLYLIEDSEHRITWVKVEQVEFKDFPCKDRTDIYGVLLNPIGGLDRKVTCTV